VLQEVMNQSLAVKGEQVLYALSGTADSYNSSIKSLSINSQNVFITSDTFLYDVVADDVISNAAAVVGQGVLAVYNRYGNAVFVAAIGNIPELGTYLEEFPDANFRAEVLWRLNYQDSGNRTDSSIITWYDLIMMASEESLYVGNMDISDMTGLRHFCGLQYLYCYSNQLTTLDVSNNAILRYLECSDNQLTFLDISHNAALEYLSCGWNLLDTLDVSDKKELRSLYCGGNQLSALDISKNSALEYLSCQGNQITAMDVSNNRELASLMCYYNPLHKLDVSANIKLEYLDCDGTQLTTLDVSQNTALRHVDCRNNQLVKLDVSKNTALEYLFCYNNRLTSLDVSHNSELYFLDCTENYMISPADVMGWQNWGLVMDGTFFFYPQKSGSGVSVSGLVKSYNPQHYTYLELWREGEAEAAYTLIIDKENSGSGQVEQPFAFPAVEPGTYTLVITKDAHTSFTVRNIVVGAGDVDLTKDNRPEVRLMTMRCGDINGDGNINNSDLTILWQQANYNGSAAAADNKLCDLNGDGLINNIDLTILWLAYNYNRGEVEIQ
jgi:Leucine-rich repeat (LRR) protein